MKNPEQQEVNERDCDFVLDNTDESTNIWRCRTCRKTVSVLGDFSPPPEACDRNPFARPESVSEVILEAVEALLKKHKDAYSMEFVALGNYFASWTPSNGLRINDGAAESFNKLRKRIVTSPSGQRFFKIPYRVWSGDKLFEDEYGVRVER